MLVRYVIKFDTLIDDHLLNQIPPKVWKSSTTKFLDPAAGGGQILIRIAAKLRKYGHSDANIRRRVVGIFDTQMARNYAERMGALGRLVCDILEVEDMDFDTVIMNPPYQKQMHIDIMERALARSKQYVVSIQPAGWVVSQKYRILGVRQSSKAVLEQIADHARSLQLVNMCEAFNGEVKLYDTGGIFVIDKNYHGPVSVTNLAGDTYLCPNIMSVNEHGNDPTYMSIEKKILATVDTHGDVLSRRNDTNYPYSVEIARIRGNLVAEGKKTTPDSLYGDYRQDDYFTWVPNDREVNTVWSDSKRHNIGFKTKKSATSFLNFLRTKTARFALKLVKSNSTVDSNHLKVLPNLDWSCDWTDEQIQHTFGFTNAEMEYISNNLPDY
mgnify:CR=1 FL=1|jgi:hypothetical protein